MNLYEEIVKGQALAAGNPDLRRAAAKAAEQRQRIAESKAKKTAK